MPGVSMEHWRQTEKFFKVVYHGTHEQEIFQTERTVHPLNWCPDLGGRFMIQAHVEHIRGRDLYAMFLHGYYSPPRSPLKERLESALLRLEGMGDQRLNICYFWLTKLLGHLSFLAAYDDSRHNYFETGFALLEPWFSFETPRRVKVEWCQRLDSASKLFPMQVPSSDALCMVSSNLGKRRHNGQLTAMEEQHHLTTWKRLERDGDSLVNKFHRFKILHFYDAGMIAVSKTAWIGRRKCRMVPKRLEEKIRSMTAWVGMVVREQHIRFCDPLLVRTEGFGYGQEYPRRWFDSVASTWREAPRDLAQRF